MIPAPVLKIDNLRTYFFSRSKQAFIRSVDGVNLEIDKGETLGVVGESGSGKSVTALSVMGLVKAEPGVITGKIGLKTDRVMKNLLQDMTDYVNTESVDGRVMNVRKNNRRWQKHVDKIMHGVRGKEIAMIFQNPKLSMNPFTTVGRQIRESILLNTGIHNKKEAKQRALHWLERVKIDSPLLRYNNNPHGLSGGMCQRAMIAMALASEPSLLIADEPTTGLDATIQSKIVELILGLKSEVGVTTMLISHDIDVVKTLSDKVAVMYGGTVLEHGPSSAIFAGGDSDTHPYTAALLDSIPNQREIREKAYLNAIKGEVPDTINLHEGCRFFPRCSKMTAGIHDRCEHDEPDLMTVSTEHKIRCWLYGG